MDKISLTAAEVIMASNFGAYRQNVSIHKGLKNNHGLDSDGWSEHIEGVIGEMAFAKWRGVYYPFSVNTFKAPDVAGYQIRKRTPRHRDLIVRPSDSNSDIFVLITGDINNYKDMDIVGWIYGADAKYDKWLKPYGGRPPAYFVPQDCLFSLDTLPFLDC